MWYLASWVFALFVMAAIIDKLVRFAPLAGASGIPQIMANIRGISVGNWWKTIVAKVISCIMAVLAGLSLGREGPSIQLGGMVGQGIGRILRRSRMEEHCLISSGAGAGLAAAFNAPMASVMFTMEVMHKSLSAVVLLPTLVAAITSTFVSRMFFGRQTIFAIPNMPFVEADTLPQLLFLGILTGFAGYIFNKTMLAGGKLYQAKFFKNNYMRYVFPLLLTIPVGFILPDIMGGGDVVVEHLVDGHATLQLVIIVLTAKLLFTMLSACSGIPGGSLQPMLVMGALCGYLYGIIAISSGFVAPDYLMNCIVFGMAGFFAAAVQAPLTGILLVLELTGSFSHLVAVALVTLFAYSTAAFCKGQPIYDVMLEKFLAGDITRENLLQHAKRRNIMEMPVESGSTVEGKTIGQVDWPGNALIVAVKRGEHDIIPNGQTSLVAGDYLYIVVNIDAARQIRALFRKKRL
jgi:H+/Cl- antiporter ClcA